MSDFIALVATNEQREKISGGRTVFWVEDEPEARRVSLHLSRIFKAMVHDLGNGIYLIVTH